MRLDEALDAQKEDSNLNNTNQVITALKKAKRDARNLTGFLKSRGIEVTRDLCLEAAARLRGYRSWTALRSAAEAAAQLAPPPTAVAKWNRFVFRIDQVGEHSEEQWFFLPAGISLADQSRYDRWGVFKDTDRVLVPKGLERGARVVVMGVYSLVPNVGKYGLPWFAHTDLAAAWFRDEIQVAALKDLDVQFRDMGDDSGSQYWFEARVHPDLAEALLRRQGMLTAFAGTFADAGTDTDRDSRGAELAPILTALEHGIHSGLGEHNADVYLKETANARVALHDPYASYSVAGLHVYLVGTAEQAAEQHRAKLRSS